MFALRYLRNSFARKLNFASLLFVAAIALAQSQPGNPNSAADQLPPAPGAKVINLTDAGFSNEPAIAVNPRNPEQLVAAWQINASAAYSHDGGRNWSKASGVAPKNYKKSGDVSVAYGADGAAYLCYIAFDKLGTTYYWAHNATRNGVFVRRSPDGGKTWEKMAHAVIEHATQTGIPFEDKPSIVSDTTSGHYSGNLYVGWTQFTLEKTVVLFSRSTDAGASWSPPIEISTHGGLPRDDNGAVEGFSAAVAPDGAIYAVWADGTNIAFTWSRDGGKSFTPSRNIIATGPSYFPVSGIDGGNGFPQIGLDPRSGLLYVTW